jgi:hypothetical protein
LKSIDIRIDSLNQCATTFRSYLLDTIPISSDSTSIDIGIQFRSHSAVSRLAVAAGMEEDDGSFMSTQPFHA